MGIENTASHPTSSRNGSKGTGVKVRTHKWKKAVETVLEALKKTLSTNRIVSVSELSQGSAKQ